MDALGSPVELLGRLEHGGGGGSWVPQPMLNRKANLRVRGADDARLSGRTVPLRSDNHAISQLDIDLFDLLNVRVRGSTGRLCDNFGKIHAT